MKPLSTINRRLGIGVPTIKDVLAKLSHSSGTLLAVDFQKAFDSLDAELEPVERKKNSVWRGFVIITLMLKTKRKTAKAYNPVSHVFKEKKERKGRLRMFCLVFGQLPH